MLLKSSSLLLALGCLAWVGPGCSSAVRLRPDGTPERQFCPDGALQAMRELDVTEGDLTWILIDRMQRDRKPIVIAEGPIESILDSQLGDVPEGTRLFGHVWTTPPEVVIRYHEALLPDGARIPFCAVAEEGGGGLFKHVNSPRGVAILEDNKTALRVVGAYN